MRKLTILIPALNEEENIEYTVNSLFEVAGEVLEEAEVIVVDDGSTDKTGAIIDGISAKNPAVVSIHHSQPKGLGYIFQEGISKAKFDYLTFIPGDNAYNAESLRPFFSAVADADMVLGYRTNQFEARQVHRAAISMLYTWIMKVLFLSPVKDFHGPVIYPVQIVRNIHLTSTISQVEFIIKLLRKKVSYVQVPVQLNLDKEGRSRALRWRTFVSVLQMVTHLVVDKDSKQG